ncbi:TetR/AcrR family transcriptional regulator [Humibacter sp. RRB41]|uniref:TetR/AcrR family transcriptional regulator n=1 Tax=Humibacter sp. RRB41 TaxID=2919946 RepID=UPI001FAAB7B3|nr:TetR/AcrR family transcriptional regulator [Humibacter sp. RRB41]
MAYHHGHLRESLIDVAVEAIEHDGVDRLSLRDVARTVGVSHAASAYHFGDRKGLFTAIATDGFQRLAVALEAADGGFVDAGVAYVRFAIADRGRFEVMFRPELVNGDDPALLAAMARASAVLGAGAAERSGDSRVNGLAAWSIVHGFSTLWNAGVIRADGATADELASSVAAVLFER